MLLRKFLKSLKINTTFSLILLRPDNNEESMVHRVNGKCVIKEISIFFFKR